MSAVASQSALRAVVLRGDAAAVTKLADGLGAQRWRALLESTADGDAQTTIVHAALAAEDGTVTEAVGEEAPGLRSRALRGRCVSGMAPPEPRMVSVTRSKSIPMSVRCLITLGAYSG